ncbi:MAG: SBBP repeat-containing protein, partial [Candidatus Latescibacteria bacterium]|nr:SBBP repeat-containing protein [Candidatus Latescibacterota bacterium]
MKNYSRYSLIISVFCTLLPILLQAQVSQSWISRYDGPGNNVDEARALAVDVHGNVYVTGFSRSSGSFYSEDYATIKYDSTGNQAWLARYNGPGYSSDQANAIAVDTFGNVYVTGVCNDSNTGADFATIKYNSSGNQEWLTPFNGSGVNAPDIAYAIALDNDGNVYVTGYSWAVSTGYENYATVKYNASGIEQWVAYYNGPGNYSDHAYAIAVDNSANVYVTGRSIISGSWNYDYATVKYNASGTEQWVARYNGTQNEVDEAKKIAVDNSGNVYVTGFSVGSGTGRDYVTIKYDSSGTEEWVMRYTEPGNYRDEAYAIALDNSGNVYVTGVSYGVGITGSPDYVTIKYNASGTQQWLARYNGTGNTWDEARAITLDAAGNVYVTGICGSGTNG